MHMITVCVKEEQKNAKRNNQIKGLLTIREYQNFLEESKLVGGGASAACIVSNH